MSHIGFAWVAGVAVLVGTAVWAGEILILQPATPASDNRNEREAQRLNDRARQRAGQAVPETTYILGPAGVESQPRTRDSTDRLMQDARDYIGPAQPAAAAGSGQVILRATPLSDAERARLKARSYAAEPAKSSQRNCSTVTNQVGMIGEGSGAQKSENVSEKGGSAVSPNCR